MKTYKDMICFNSTAEMEFVNITNAVQKIIDSSGVREGVVTIFAQHTTMGVVINHDEPMLLQDFMRVLYRLAPQDERYSHDMFELRRGSRGDGRSNGNSHCKALLVGNNVTVPISEGHMMLSNIQSIFAVEFDGARKRDVVVVVNG